MSTVTLHDGREVASDSPEWLVECEAKALLKLSPGARDAALNDRAGKRGVDSVNALRAVMAGIYRAGAARAETDGLSARRAAVDRDKGVQR